MMPLPAYCQYRVRYTVLFGCSYAAGEYFVGVLSTGQDSRFVLRVSTATAQAEISTHMRAAAAIVDNLTIMSNMNPHVRERGSAQRKRNAEPFFFVPALKPLVVSISCRNLYSYT